MTRPVGVPPADRAGGPSHRGSGPSIAFRAQLQLIREAHPAGGSKLGRRKREACLGHCAYRKKLSSDLQRKRI
jgi:hypothetical protein